MPDISFFGLDDEDLADEDLADEDLDDEDLGDEADCGGEEDFSERDDLEDRYYREAMEGDGESGLENMARVAADIEAGRAEVPRGWQLDRPSPGVLVWTTPAGRRYASDLKGEPLPLP